LSTNKQIKGPKRTHTPWKKRNAAFHLMDMGWKPIPNDRDNPRFSEEALRRIDALAHCMSKGKYDPADKGKRSRARWSKAFGRCHMMLESPDWWEQRFPEQFAIISPPTWPGPITVKRTRIGRVTYYHIQEFAERVFVKDGFLPLYEGDILHYEKLWDPDDLDNAVILERLGTGETTWL
jgi:hypothetical protein